MVNDLDDAPSRSLTDFLRNHREHVDHLQSSGEPEVLTINGRPSVVVQSAEGYEALLAQLQYTENVLSLQKALQHAADAEFLTPLAEEDVDRMTVDLDDTAKDRWTEGPKQVVLSRVWNRPIEAKDLAVDLREVEYRSFRVVYTSAEIPVVLRLFKGEEQSMTLNLLKIP